MDDRHLPNFILVGIQRTGTTWLYTALISHPDVFLPHVKEVHFFDRNYDKGIDWYRRYYSSHQNEKCRGDITPNYIHEPEIARRIYDLIPHCRILITLRNPVDFTHSIYKRRKRITPHLGSFESFIQSTNYPQLGLYSEKILSYMDLFPRESIFINYYENLKSDHEQFIESICRFLGIESDKITVELNRIVNPTVEPRSAAINKIAHQFVCFIRRRRSKHLNQIINSVRPYFNNPIYMRQVGRQDKEARGETQRAQLIDFYYEDIKKLSELVEKDLITYWGLSGVE